MDKLDKGFVRPSEESNMHLPTFPDLMQEDHETSKENSDSTLFSFTKGSSFIKKEISSLPVDWFITPEEEDLFAILNALKGNKHCILVTPTRLSSDSLNDIIKTSHESKVKCFPVHPALFTDSFLDHIPAISHPDFISIRRSIPLSPPTGWNAPLSYMLMQDIPMIFHLMKHEFRRHALTVIRDSEGGIEMLEARLEFSHSKVAHLLYATAIPPESMALEVIKQNQLYSLALLSISEILDMAEEKIRPVVHSKTMQKAVQNMHAYLHGALNEHEEELFSIESLLQTTDVTRTILKSIEFLNEE